MEAQALQFLTFFMRASGVQKLDPWLIQTLRLQGFYTETISWPVYVFYNTFFFMTLEHSYMLEVFMVSLMFCRAPSLPHCGMLCCFWEVATPCCLAPGKGILFIFISHCFSCFHFYFISILQQNLFMNVAAHWVSWFMRCSLLNSLLDLFALI